MKKTALTIGFLACAIMLPALTFPINKAEAQKDRRFHTMPVRSGVDVQLLHELTDRIFSLAEQVRTAPAETRQSLINDLRRTAASRKQLLLGLMLQNPDQVLDLALPDHILALLSEDLQDLFEQRVEVDGNLEVLFEENQNGSRLHHFLKIDDKQIELHFRGNSTPDLLTGTQVHVRGVRVGDDLALDGAALATTSSDPGMQVTSTQVTSTATSIAPNTFGVQKVLMILVNFQDKPTQPYTVADAQNVLATTSNYYLEASYGQTSLTGNVTGWYTIPVSYTTCNTSSIATYAKQAAQAAGYNLSAYNRFVYAFPDAACSWGGWGTIGGNPSSAWINGADLTAKILSHELGHNFGLYHSRYLNCTPNVTGTIGSGCTSADYGDSVDVMGIVDKFGHFNAYQKTRLGWLNYNVSPPILTVSSSGVYSIDAYETIGTNPKALRILKAVDPSTGAKTWYWMEFRQPIGFDGFVSTNNNLLNGVVFHQQSDSSAAENYLLDMSPGSISLQFDPALVAGQSFSDTNAGVTFSVLSVSSTGATVSVSFGPQLCVRANPSLSISPSASQWVSPGTTVNYQVSLTNNDNGGCFASSFDLQSTVPSGWSVALDNSTITLSSGASTTTTLRVTSPSSATNGYYTIGLKVLNNSANSYAASGTATCSIMSGLDVAVVSDQASYTAGQTATINARVTSSGALVSGATVAFTITKPNGVKATGKVTADANGAAVFKYRFNKQKDPVGTYQVSAGASVNGVVGSGVTSFVLK